MVIQEQPLKHWIDNFYGYGSWHARFWFVAYEEGGGDLPEEVAARIDYFNREHAVNADTTLCDIRALYGHIPFPSEASKAALFKNRYEYRFGRQAVVHGVWRNLIAFVHGHRSEQLPDIPAYQKDRFVTSTSHEALIRLYPLPSPHNHAWYYSWLDMPKLPFLKSRATYQDHLYRHRIQTILQNIERYKPEVVLMYGMNNINHLKASVGAVFPNVQFRMVKAVKQQIPQHHIADINGIKLLITTQIPALRHNRIETGFDWAAFGESLNADEQMTKCD